MSYKFFKKRFWDVNKPKHSPIIKRHDSEDEFGNPALIAKLTIRIYVRNLFKSPLPDSYIRYAKKVLLERRNNKGMMKGEKKLIEEETLLFKGIANNINVDLTFDKINMLIRILQKKCNLRTEDEINYILHYIEPLEPFNIFDPCSNEILSIFITCQIISSNNIIYQPNDKQYDTLYILLSGNCETFITESFTEGSQERVIKEYNTLSCINIDEFINNKTYKCSLRTKSTCTFGLLSRSDYNMIMNSIKEENMNKIQLICDTSAFQSCIQPIELCYLSFLFKSMKFNTDQIVVKQNQNSEYFYLISSGQIEVYNQNNQLLTHSCSIEAIYSPIHKDLNYQSMMSNNKYISLLERCQHFGAFEMINSKPFDASYRSRSQSICFVMSQSTFFTRLPTTILNSIQEESEMSKDFLIQRKRLLPTLSEPIYGDYPDCLSSPIHLQKDKKNFRVTTPNGYHKANLDKPVDILPIITRNGPNHPLNTVIGSLTNKMDFIDEIPSSPIKIKVNKKDTKVEKDNAVHSPTLFQNILNSQHFSALSSSLGEWRRTKRK